MNTSMDEICKAMAVESSGFSGADLAALVRSAAVRCLNENRSGEVAGVELRHFTDARRYDMTDPSSNTKLVERLLRWKP